MIFRYCTPEGMTDDSSVSSCITRCGAIRITAAIRRLRKSPIQKETAKTRFMGSVSCLPQY